MQKWLTQRHHRWAAGLLLGGLLVRGAIALFLPPGFDEAYYYLYTQHLDWSYFDHPLLVALSTGLGPWITGEVSQFTIRLGTLLLHTGALWLLYLTSFWLFSSQAAVLTLAIVSLIPIFLVGFGVLTLPDAPLIFFWTATVYVAVREFWPRRGRDRRQEEAEARRQKPGARRIVRCLSPVASGRNQGAGGEEGSDRPHSYTPTYRLAIIGLLVGLACLSKYHGLILGMGLVGFCLTSSRYRVALRSPWMVLSFGLFLLAITPILIWNVQHDWVSLRFQSGRAVPDRSYSLLDLLVTFLAGVAYLFPSFGFPLWGVSLKTALSRLSQFGEVWKAKKDRREEARGKIAEIDSPLRPTPYAPHPTPHVLLLWLSLPLMLGFTLMGGYRSILPTWAMPGFWSATLLLGWRAAGWQCRFPRLVQRWLWGSGVAIALCLLIAVLHVNLGILQKNSRYALLGGFLSPTADASIQLIDIHQLRAGFADSASLRHEMQGIDYLFTNDLYLAGQVGMALASLPHRPITCFEQDLRGFAFWSKNDGWVGKDGLLVTPAHKAETTLAQYQGYFEKVQKVAEIPINRGGAIVQVIEIYRCDRLLKPYPRSYGI
ncbi:ArnT family glycosyltransferase [Leptothermofonsia sp. ETS-13]|uniref:ArnT family glycosyltransferase n=1 Tax=Leptothermofonsia sp. ETS-13 TaxID=3035696 RepID=UPI003BA241DC